MEEFTAMMEEEGEEVSVVRPQPVSARGSADKEEEQDELNDDEVMRESSFDLYDDGETQLGPTQGDTSSKASHSQARLALADANNTQIFRPLFDD